MTLTIEPRETWDALPPDFQAELASTHNGWFWHWLGNGYPPEMSNEQILQSVQRYHMLYKRWSDAAYSFAVGRDARAYEVRGWDVAGGHTRGYNNSSMAIVFLIGEGERPTPEMFATAYAIMAERPEITGPRSHRDVGSTSCPGDDIASEVDNPQFKDLMTNYTYDQAATAIEGAYLAILGRTADQGGLDYWVDRIMNGVSLESVRWAFVEVRLAADAERVAALAGAIQSTGGPDPEVVADQTYRLFLDDLIALAK